MAVESHFEIEENIEKFGEQRHAWQIDRDMTPEMDYRGIIPLTYPNVGYPPIPVAFDNVIWGIDISGYYDGIVDWVKFKNRGGSFCVIKIADGTVQTKYAVENVNGALNAGLVVLGYCWLYRNIRISGKAQGDFWAKTAKALGVQDVAVDYEWTFWNGQQDNPDPSDLYGAVIPFEQAWGKKPLIYSAPGYMGQMPAFWKAYRLWIAQYGTLKPNAVTPWGASGQTFWQLTDRWPGLELGVDPNSSKSEDGDLFNGTQADFNAMFTKTPVPTPIKVLGDGVTYNKDVFNGVTYHLVKFDLHKITFTFDDGPDANLPLVSVSDWTPDVLVAINGGGFLEDDPVGVPWGVCSSNGHQYAWVRPENPEQSIYISKDNTVSWIAPAQIWDAINYPNKFITKGFKGALLDNVVQDSRTLFGVKDGFGYWFSTGAMTKSDAADLGMSYQLDEMSNMDGGQSTAMRIKGMGVVNGENARDVATHIGINLVTGGTMSQAQEALGKSVTVRTSPHVVAGNSSPTVPNIAPHAVITYVGIVSDLDHVGDPAYSWLDLGGGSFVNYVYPPNGQRFTLLTPPPPPPPAGKNLVANVTFTVKDTDTGDVYGATLTDVPLTKQ